MSENKANERIVIVSSTAGGSTDQDGTHTINYGEILTIRATADNGFHFIGWSVDAFGWANHPLDRANPLVVMVNSDMAIAANFAIRGSEIHLGQETASFPTLDDIGPVEEIGAHIGPYRLLSVLGEGGFGIVYLAEQRKPIRRQVALKVIKPGMDSEQVIARFEAERQILALLDHPNIVQIFDGGITEVGRPYFVMEFIKGLPITEYCDRHKLSIEERLGLFQQVCEAVQHTHEKGIIHRGLKPSDILVSDHGGKPAPKVIDFGIAKAISQPLTEITPLDEHGQVVGTLEYMSPEQAGMTIHGIDTRADIYSLGIILYELLIGILPFNWEALHGVTLGEVFKTICDEDPPRPSVRLLDIETKAESGSAKHRRDVRRLSKQLYKELEWIPMKAMQKEPDRRYRTASELADDIRNYLNDVPLMAGPDSGTYLARKYVSRNARIIVLVSLIFFFMLLAGLFGMLYFLEKARGG